MLLVPLLARAEWVQWTLDPSVNAGFDYNDNFNVTDRPTRVWYSRFSADLLSKLEMDQFSMDLHGRYYGERYISVDGPEPEAGGKKTSTDDLSRDDGIFDATLRYSTEYILWELEGGYTRDQPQSSEFDGTTDFFNRITRNKWFAGPALTWIWSPQTRLRTNYSYSETFYEDRPFDNSHQSDFTGHNAAATLTHDYTEYTQLFTQVFFSSNETTQEPIIVNQPLGILSDGTIVQETSTSTSTFENDQFGIVMGGSHALSDTFTASLSGGGLVLFSESETRRIQQNSLPGTLPIETVSNRDDTAIGYLVNFSLDKSFEYTTVNARADHKLVPSSNGSQLQLDSVSLSVTQRLLEHLSGTLSASYSRTDTLKFSVGIGQSGRTNYNIGYRFIWQLTEEWALDWGYRFVRQERETNDENGNGRSGNRNAGFVNLRYQWPTKLLFP